MLTRDEIAEIVGDAERSLHHIVHSKSIVLAISPTGLGERGKRVYCPPVSTS